METHAETTANIESGPQSQHQPPQEHESPTEEGPDDGDRDRTDRTPSPQYGVGGEDEFQNVWGR